MAPWLVHTAVAAQGPRCRGPGCKTPRLSLETEGLRGAQPCSPHLGPRGAEGGVGVLGSAVWLLAPWRESPVCSPAGARAGAFSYWDGVLKPRPGTLMPAQLLRAVRPGQASEPLRPPVSNVPRGAWRAGCRSAPRGLGHIPANCRKPPFTRHLCPLSVHRGHKLGVLQPWTTALLQDRHPHSLPLPGKAALCQRTRSLTPQALCRPGLA